MSIFLAADMIQPIIGLAGRRIRNTERAATTNETHTNAYGTATC